MYCCVPVPDAMDAVAGDTAMPVTAGPVTVRTPLPCTLPEFAEMVEVPAATPVARPALLMVAAAGFPLVHVTVEVQFEVVPFEEVQVAVYCWVPVPAAMEAVAGETAMLVVVGAVTVTVLVADCPPDVAVMTVVPAATPVTRPAPLTDAVPGVLLDQVTVEAQLEFVLLE